MTCKDIIIGTAFIVTFLLIVGLTLFIGVLAESALG